MSSQLTKQMTLQILIFTKNYSKVYLSSFAQRPHDARRIASILDIDLHDMTKLYQSPQIVVMLEGLVSRSRDTSYSVT
jgi:hypothetical protein